MAKSISRTVHYKRASDLLGLYVGQSEKNIARAFHEASAEGAILFLDEADSFFRDREDAFHSWEVTIPNEFLTQVENFSGLIVCCTNRLSSLEPAVFAISLEGGVSAAHAGGKGPPFPEILWQGRGASPGWDPPET